MMVDIECWGCSFVIFQEILTGIAKKPYFFVIVRGGGGGGGADPLPPLDLRILVRGHKLYGFHTTMTSYCAELF